MSSLNKLVRERDNRMNSPRQLDVTARPAETKKICIKCRRVPTYAAYRAKWLAANPTPATRPHDIRRSRFWEWGDDLWCAWRMPEFLLVTECPTCSGNLVEVTW